MLVFFSGRRVKPGAWEQFRRAWQPEGMDTPPHAVAIYHARNVKDEDEVISFGIFDATKDQISEIRGGGDPDAELRRQDAMAAFVEHVPLEGIYEVVEELRP